MQISVKKIIIILTLFNLVKLSYSKWDRMNLISRDTVRGCWSFLPTKDNLYIYYREGNKNYIGKYVNEELINIKEINYCLYQSEAFIFKNRNYVLFIVEKNNYRDLYVVEYYDMGNELMFCIANQITDYYLACPYGETDCGINYYSVYVEEKKYVHVVCTDFDISAHPIVIYMFFDGNKWSNINELNKYGDQYSIVDIITIPKIIVDNKGNKHVIWRSGDSSPIGSQTAYKYTDGEKWYGPVYINNFSSSCDGIEKDENNNIIVTYVDFYNKNVRFQIKRNDTGEWSEVKIITNTEIGIDKFPIAQNKLYLILEGNNIASIFLDENRNTKIQGGRLIRLRLDYNDLLNNNGNLKLVGIEFSDKFDFYDEIYTLDYYYNEKMNILYILSYYYPYYIISCENYIENVSNKYESNWLKVIIGIIITIVIIKYLKYGVKVVYNLIINLIYQ